MSNSVLVYDRIDPTDASLEWLEQQGVAVTRGQALWREKARTFDEDEIILAARGYDAVMGASSARFTRRVIEALPHLRYICKLGKGIDTIDLEAATQHGVLVANTPDQGGAKSVAEHAIAFMLGLRKNFLHWTPQYMRAGGWRAGYYSEALFGTTVGLVGLGRIGREVANRLAGWEVRILAYDPFVKESPGAVSLTDLHTLLAESDIVSLHAAPNPDNRHIIDGSTLRLMKPGAILVNVGRSWLVDTVALRHALQTGQLAGAGIDVFDVEPPSPEDALFQCPNVLFSPHTAAWTRCELERSGWHAARNLIELITGQDCASLINPEARRYLRPAAT